MKIVLKQKILQWGSYENESIDENTLRLEVIRKPVNYFFYEKDKCEQDFCADSLKEKSIIKVMNNYQIISKKGNLIIYFMDLSTLSELKKYILKQIVIL